jgi:hypothetical protein
VSRLKAGYKANVCYTPKVNGNPRYAYGHHTDGPCCRVVRPDIIPRGPDGIRTRDFRLDKPTLLPLSYKTKK